MEIVADYLSTVGDQFIDPKKRVFGPYIFISIFIAFGWFMVFRKYSLRKAFKKIFDKRATFASRGDESGTHKAEIKMWNNLNMKTNDFIEKVAFIV